MPYSVSRVPWEQAEPLLKDVRERVFICEYRIPKSIEFDRKDRTAYHMLVCDDITQEPIATGRILNTGEIGRIAVVMEHRKLKLDQIVIQGLMQIAKELSLNEVFIHSPLDAVEYFRKNKFYTVGSVFMEAGLPKQRMACPIDCINYNKCYLSH
ncbi:GNAT family N-acetyltransferase [Thalassotalea atypica]|uniref:GNAT family N-acetyltransferase n=1 Tax=Thalassotalea atypica TaxID=2054316 RepID=UPI00257372F0|nr:GNAT family N-acyltransferase [Thalassotalea atypica]